MASYDFVNYSLRPNKTVERKLMFEILAALGKALDFPAYQYVGLGSMWFVDFVMAHKILSIDELYSIEDEAIGASRARFNRPYACVKVIEGDSTSVLPGLALDKRPSLIWLDYDTSLEGPALVDLELLCRTAMTGSVIIASINAHKGRLPEKDENDIPYANNREKLFALAGDLVPQQLPLGTMKATKYPSFLSSLLFTHLRSTLRKTGREADKIVPLFNFEYSDNAPMVTIGAAILSDPQAKAVSDIQAAANFLRFASEVTSIEIGVAEAARKWALRLRCGTSCCKHALRVKATFSTIRLIYCVDLAMLSGASNESERVSYERFLRKNDHQRHIT